MAEQHSDKAGQQQDKPAEHESADAEQSRAGEGSTATAVQTPPPADAPAAPPFDREELSELEAEDRHAGSVIGKMLALFFLYTVIAMIIVGVWTFKVVV